MKKLIALLLVLVMVAGLVACAGSNDETKGNDTTNTENTADSNGDSNTGSGEPIYIGLSAKITGADAANGDRMVKAAQMAVDEVNAAGGLLGGRKVELVIQDDATDNAMAVNVANIFAGNDKISAVVGPWNSGMILAAEGVYKDAKIPFFGLGTNPKLLELDNEYCFLVRANDNLMASCAAKLIIDEFKVKSVGIMYTNNEFGTGAMEVIEAACKDAGMAVYPEAINIGDTDVTGQILDLKSKGAECMVVWASDAEYVLTARQAYELGLQVPTVASPAITMDQVRDLCEPEWVEGWYSVTDFVGNSMIPRSPRSATSMPATTAKARRLSSTSPTSTAPSSLCSTPSSVRAAPTVQAIRDAVAETKDFPMLQGNATCDENKPAGPLRDCRADQGQCPCDVHHGFRGVIETK